MMALCFCLKRLFPTFARLVVFVALSLATTGVRVAQGEVWLRKNPLLTSRPITGLAYGSGRFVAFDDGLTTLRSEDGIVWSATDLPPHVAFDVSYTNGKFYAPGYGRVYSSANGISWSYIEVSAGPLRH